MFKLFRKKKKEEIKEVNTIDLRWGFDEKRENVRSAEVTVFEDYDIRVIFCGYNKCSLDKVQFIFKVINNSDYDITLQCDGLAINHKMVENIMSSDFLRNSWGYAKLSTDEKMEFSELDKCIIQCKLALCNDFLDIKRYHIDFFLDLENELGDDIIYDTSNDFDVLMTEEYRTLLAENKKLEKKFKEMKRILN